MPSVPSEKTDLGCCGSVALKYIHTRHAFSHRPPPANARPPKLQPKRMEPHARCPLPALVQITLNSSRHGGRTGGMTSLNSSRHGGGGAPSAASPAHGVDNRPAIVRAASSLNESRHKLTQGVRERERGFCFLPISLLVGFFFGLGAAGRTSYRGGGGVAFCFSCCCVFVGGGCGGCSGGSPVVVAYTSLQ